MRPSYTSESRNVSTASSKWWPSASFVMPRLAERSAQRAAAHLRAQGAGVILFAHVEHDLFDIRFQAGVRYAERCAQLCHRREIHAVEPELDCDGLERKRLRIVPAQLIERHEQHERILAARDADGDGVARRDHVIILHAPAHQTGERVQVIHSGTSKMKIETANSSVKRSKTEISRAK